MGELGPIGGCEVMDSVRWAAYDDRWIWRILAMGGIAGYFTILGVSPDAQTQSQTKNFVPRMEH